MLQTGKRTGLYCADCEAWVQWLTKKADIREAYHRFIQKDDLRGKAIKKIIRYGGITSIRCEKCDCLLYTSNVDMPRGQFDLIDANFCPKCGVEFVDDHKNFSKK